MVCDLCVSLQAVEALKVMLKQQNMLHRQRNICSLLQVCHTLRAAVQEESNAINISLIVSRDGGFKSDKPSAIKASSLAAWLLKHPRLVGSLEVTGLNAGNEYEAFARSLEQAAAQFPAPWSFITDRLTARILMAISPTNLTALAVTGDLTTQTALSRIPGHLTNLRDLKFGISCTPSSLDGFANLKQLTKLSMEGMIDSFADLRCLPQQLQVLEINLYQVKQPLNVVLQHLTCLQQLQVSQCTYPADMQQLAESTPAMVLPWLQHVNISFKSNGCVFETGNFWQKLPNLQSLRLSEPTVENDLCRLVRQLRSFHGEEGADDADPAVTEVQYCMFMQQLAAATAMTELHIRALAKINEHTPCVAQYLANMSNLQSLDLYPSPVLSATGIQQLAGLTRLTSICLNSLDMMDQVLHCRTTL